MDKLHTMRVFCCVVREEGFSAAARKLDTSKVMVSRAVTALEKELGIRLLQRTTRKMSLTEDGAAYYERCQALLEEFDALDDLVKESSNTVKGRLRLSIPTEAFSVRHLVPLLGQFAKDYPDLSLDLQMVDRYVDIVDEGIDAAIRIGSLEDSSLIAKKLANMAMVLCASRDYIEQHEPIQTPRDIAQHPFILDRNYRSRQGIAFYKGDHEVEVNCTNKISVNNALATCEFIKQGLGIGFTPDFMVKDELESGMMVKLLPDWTISQGGIYIVYSHRKHLSTKVSALVARLERYFSEEYC